MIVQASLYSGKIDESGEISSNDMNHINHW